MMENAMRLSLSVCDIVPSVCSMCVCVCVCVCVCGGGGGGGGGRLAAR